MAEAAKSGKRPAPEDGQVASDREAAAALGELASQIEAFERLAEEQPEQPAKRANKVHSLTQNTTHRKIRIGPEFQAVLPPPPPAARK